MVRYKPYIIFLMEVMTGMETMERIKRRLRFEGVFFVKGIHQGGGIAVFWKDKGAARLWSYSRNHRDVEIQLENLPKWRFTGFYGFLVRHRRKDSWQLLKMLKRDNNLLWCCTGDFNDLLSQSEKRGNVCHPTHSLGGSEKQWICVH